MMRAMTNYIEGMSTVLELDPPRVFHGSYLKRIRFESDAQAIYRDWQKVGQAIQQAMGKASRELNYERTR